MRKGKKRKESLQWDFFRDFAEEKERGDILLSLQERSNPAPATISRRNEKRGGERRGGKKTALALPEWLKVEKKKRGRRSSGKGCGILPRGKKGERKKEKFYPSWQTETGKNRLANPQFSKKKTTR